MWLRSADRDRGRLGIAEDDVHSMVPVGSMTPRRGYTLVK
jgi:hypothetical protein